MKLWGRLALIVVLAGWWAGCGGQPTGDSNADIQKAIEQHLASRPGLATGQMVMEIKDVRIEGDKAEAEVIFRSTAEPPAQMTFRYELRRESSGWKVDSGRTSAAESPHPSSGDAPPTDPTLPEGHPTLPDTNPPAESAPQQQ
ncbi:MAG: hypothetical protein HY649_12440 [Acidobacteria bacterium]|nr:hypothetical protein [Acidobacteriota bacterium]